MPLSPLYDGAALLFQFLDSFAFLVLATVGLAVIFGMMGVINLAHGEFILVGIYGTALTYHAGLPLPVAMVSGVVMTVIFGIIVERLVVQHLYDRLLDSMVATWGLALVVAQLLLITFGSSLDSISTPMGNVAYGPYTSGTYRSVFLPLVALAVLVGLYVLFTRTEFGVKARATIEDPETARAMGIDTDRMYVTTFALGSGLAGLTGALYAPAIGAITPDRGSIFLVEAFVAVVVGGPSVVIGTLSASGLLGFVNAVFSFQLGTFVGLMAMLIVAIIALRVLPDGISGYIEQWRQRRRADQ
ncbi:ABC-type transport system permease protein (probable substrate urea/short-chain amides) [Natronomonas pharaonis DSM 2160]|uniref:ABC-type transport system permease protein (Probable substrate urea/short-chain amides) n=1 Tax=Natronomonas pharaonis (strain ATCC 35678 / DSM 2160 / CIP 103997 / JCM 8858 / NBRC 14720 / NCIMB 2260 / Gabara) TaxID=348780 RepID=A0A1U7EVN3_NATPD|nr:ABC-type transport system permease protein (probable substrate urea/short-chain amides) [Natronomonas pharaonis DSM 2160]